MWYIYSRKWNDFTFQGLIGELLDYNLRRGSPAVRNDVRHLLCVLTKDNLQACDQLNAQLMSRIVIAIRGHLSSPDFVSYHFSWGAFEITVIYNYYFWQYLYYSFVCMVNWSVFSLVIGCKCETWDAVVGQHSTERGQLLGAPCQMWWVTDLISKFLLRIESINIYTCTLVYIINVFFTYVVLKLFLLSMKIKTPIVLECVALPCLRMLQLVIKPPPPSSKKNKVYIL